MKHNYQFCAVPYEAVVALSNCKYQSALVVYMQLYLNSVDNKVMISRKTLSDLTGYNSNYISEITKKLESLGLIKKEKHFNNASTYHLTVKELKKKQETDEADSCDTVSVETASTVNTDTYEQITRDRLQETDVADSNIRNLEFRNTIMNTTTMNEYSTIEVGRSSKDECKTILKEMKNTLDRAVARYYDGGCTWGDIAKLCLEYKNKTYTKLLLGEYFETVENFSKEKYEEWFNKIIAEFKTIWDNNNTALPA